MTKAALTVGAKVDLTGPLRSSAVVFDRRAKEEFAPGHVRRAKHIPLDRLSSDRSKLERSKPAITCCRSVMRSRETASLLCRHGLDACDGGPWTSVRTLKAR